MMLGPLLAVSSWQRGIFPFGSEWSQPSSHYSTRLSSHHFCPLPTAFFESRYLGFLTARMGPNIYFFLSYHVTTPSQALKHFHIRPPLPPSLSTRSLTSLPLNGHFHLKDAWCLSDGVLEMVLSLSPSDGNGFWVAGCNRNTPYRLSERWESGWESKAQLPLANAHLCQPLKWNITSVVEGERLSPYWCLKMAPVFFVVDIWPILDGDSVLPRCQGEWNMLFQAAFLFLSILASVYWWNISLIFSYVSSTLARSSELKLKLCPRTKEHKYQINPVVFFGLFVLGGF